MAAHEYERMYGDTNVVLPCQKSSWKDMLSGGFFLCFYCLDRRKRSLYVAPRTYTLYEPLFDL